jgi:hypothetical protein
MEAGQAADCFGMMPGHDLQQGDFVQSYTQSRLGGVETWIRLPEDQQPAAWKGIRDPMCPLVLALHGHPDAGGFWELHCEAHLVKIGFVPIVDWRSCFFHPKWNMFLVVYVDDFKLAGPAEHMAAAWEAIRKGIVMEDPAPAGLYLRCKHELSYRVPPGGTTSVRTIEYNMEEFLRSCVERYQKLSGIAHMRHVPTPFVSDVSTGSAGADPDKLPPNRVVYMTKAKPRKSGSAGAAKGGRDPGIDDPNAWDHLWEPSPEPPTGVLQPIAANVLMKVLYAARMARCDLLRAVNGLARRIITWDVFCARLLHS